MTRKEMISKYNFNTETFTSRELDEIIHNINENNHWDIEKYISFDVLTKNSWQVNFWDNDENIVFVRIGDTNQFKAVL